MVTSELRERIVWLIVNGDILVEDMKGEAGKWLTQLDTFDGFITDMREMYSYPSGTEQKQLEAWRKENNSGKPHALLGRTSALGVAVQMFIRVTRAASTRYFMNPDAAVAWIRNYVATKNSDVRDQKSEIRDQRSEIED